MIMYIAIYLTNIAALCLLIGWVHSSTALNSDRKKPFLIGIIITIIIILAESGTVFSQSGMLNSRSVQIFSNMLGFALAPLIPITISLMLDRRILSTRKLVLLPTFVNMLAAALSPRYGLIFFVDANNQYFRGDFFFLFVTAYSLNLLLLVSSTIEEGRKYNYPILRKMVALSLFISIGTSIQIFVPSTYSAWHGVTLSLFLYLLLLSDFDNSFDPLTRLYNQAAFHRVARETVRPGPLCIILLDINDFKEVNDTYGHVYGDRVLQSMATIVKKSFGRHYRCYRFGGDEFAVIGNETNQRKIETQLRTLTTALDGMRAKGIKLPTVSYGYSIFLGGDRIDFQELLKEADDEMYHFKRLHKAEASRETAVSGASPISNVMGKGSSA